MTNRRNNNPSLRLPFPHPARRRPITPTTPHSYIVHTTADAFNCTGQKPRWTICLEYTQTMCILNKPIRNPVTSPTGERPTPIVYGLTTRTNYKILPCLTRTISCSCAYKLRRATENGMTSYRVLEQS